MESAANHSHPESEPDVIISFFDGGPNDETQAARIVELASAHRESMEAYAFAILRRWPQAQDVTQEALLVVYNRASDCQDENNLWPWLRRITQLKCYETLRRNRKRKKLADSSLHELIEQDLNLSKSISRDDSIQDQIDALQRCLTKLTPKARNVLHDFYVENKEGHDIADDQGMKPNTVWSYLHRSRQQLRRCIDRLLRSSSTARGEKSISRSHRNLLDQYFSTTYSNPHLKGKIEKLIQRHPGVYANYAAEWSALANGLTTFEEKSKTKPVPLHVESTNRQFLKLAAALAVTGIALGLLFLKQSQRQVNAMPELTLNESGHIIPEGDEGHLHFDQGNTKLALAEGTIVRPLYSKDGSDGIHLALDRGTLTANVAPQKGRPPFRVETPMGRVEVVGTKLQVRTNPLSTRVGVSQGLVEVFPSWAETKEATPEQVRAGESLILYPYINGVLRFHSQSDSTSPPWQSHILTQSLNWDFRDFQTDETSSQIAVGLFESPKSLLTESGRNFFHSKDVIATAPIALPEKFRFSVELRLAESKSKIKTIAANSPINLATNGFRFGFDYHAKDDRNVLRINFGDGQESKKIAFREGTISVGQWHLVEVDVDLVEGAVQLRIDNQESDWKPLKLIHFKRTGSLFFGSQEPGRGTSPMDGMMRSMTIEPLR